jgi:heat shock protein HslJ
MRRVMTGCALLAAVAVVAGCAAYGGGSAEDPTVGGVPLEGTTWSLVELGGRPARAAGDNGTPTLRLDAAQTRASGNTGCNSFGGGYELNGESLRFGALASTRRACVDEALNRQEAAFLRVLADTRTWRITGGTLVLRGDAGEVARFSRQAAR